MTISCSGPSHSDIIGPVTTRDDWRPLIELSSSVAHVSPITMPRMCGKRSMWSLRRLHGKAQRIDRLLACGHQDRNVAAGSEFSVAGDFNRIGRARRQRDLALVAPDLLGHRRHA